MWQKKVCLIGDFGVGKTSLVRRFVEGCFDERYLSTLGVQVSRKAITLPTPAGAVALTLIVWDIAGDGGHSGMTTQYLRSAAGGIVVCDLTRPDTLVAAQRHGQTFRQVNPTGTLVFVGNKADLTAERRVSADALSALAAPFGAPRFEASAKTGDHVDAFFHTLGHDMLRGDHVLA